MVRTAAQAKPDVLPIRCANVPTAPLVAEPEAEIGIPMLDSASIVLWKALRLMGIDTRPAGDWGRLFA
jgi:maleate isomerase